uniref:Uncharacterized protein LOC116939365 isoform X3 n=1 Tax=Petromyzon marinus TaxID=7757 RepID=A0AAJ7SQR4_PETMA|nr:uncharacterized protein LOC116939365 isoform X3 [Petromyzon marinus]
MNIPQAIPSVLLLLLHSAFCSSRVLPRNVSNTSSAGHTDAEAVTTPQMHTDLWISPRVMLDEMLNWTGTQKELLPVSANHEFVISKCGRVVEQKTDVDILEIVITVMYVGGSDLFPDQGRMLQVRDNIQGLKLLQPQQQTSASQDYQEFDIDLSNKNVMKVSYIATLDPALALDGVNISLAASVIRTQSGTEAEIATSTLFIMQVAKFKTTPHHGLHFVGFVVAFVMVGLAVVCISLLRQNKCWGACSKSTQNTQVQQDVQSACSGSVCAGEGQMTSAMASLPVERLESEGLCRERKEAVDMLAHAILETFGKTTQPIRCLDLHDIESPIQAYGFLSQLIEKFDIPRDAVQHALRLLLPLHSMKQLQELLRLVHPNTCSVPISASAVGVHKEGVDVAAFPVAAGLVEHVRASLLASCRQNAKVNSPRRKQRTLKEAQLQPAKLVSPSHSHNKDMALQPSQLKSSEPSLEGETLILDSSGTRERIFVFRSQPEEESKAVIFHKKKKRNFLNYKSSKIMDVTM